MVPDRIKEISALDLTNQGLNYNQFLGIAKLFIILNGIFPKIFDKAVKISNNLSKINRIYLRSIILSSNSLEDLLTNNSFRYNSKINNILIDNDGINYQIYHFMDKYYAVPIEIKDFQFRDLYIENLASIDVNYIAHIFTKNYNLLRIIKRIPLPKKYKENLIKLNRLVLTKKIITGNNTLELINKFEYYRFNKK